MINVRDFGATGDGITDDHVALQAALVAGAGSEVYVQVGVYLTSVLLQVSAGTVIRGESRDGSILMQAAGVGPSVRLLQCTGVGIRITSLTLDGNKANQTPDEHRAGVMATGAPGLVIRSVTSRNFTGDALYIYNGSHAFMVDDVLATGCDRNGVTLGGNTVGGTIMSTQCVANKAQQLDSEPPATWTVDGVTVMGCIFDGQGQSGNNYVTTICGGSPTALSSGWIFDDNTTNGPIAVAFAKQIRITNNRGVNTTPFPSVSCLRTNEDITIEGNTWSMTQALVKSASLVYVGGAGPGATTLRARIVNNDLTATGYGAVFGVRCEGCRSVEILDNTLHGPGLASAGYAGIFIRASIVAEDFASAVIRGNTIKGWGALGITIGGNGAAKILLLDIDENTFDDASGTMLTAMSLDDGYHSAKDVRVSGSKLLGGCVTEIVHPPAGALTTSTNQRWLMP